MKNNKHLVTIPREELELLEKQADEKKDIKIDIYFKTSDRFYYIYDMTHVYPSVIEKNSTIDILSLDLIPEIIMKANEIVAKSKNNEINALSNELTTIKSKWWYKLFN